MMTNQRIFVWGAIGVLSVVSVYFLYLSHLRNSFTPHSEPVDDEEAESRDQSDAIVRVENVSEIEREHTPEIVSDDTRVIDAVMNGSAVYYDATDSLEATPNTESAVENDVIDNADTVDTLPAAEIEIEPHITQDTCNEKLDISVDQIYEDAQQDTTENNNTTTNNNIDNTTTPIDTPIDSPLEPSSNGYSPDSEAYSELTPKSLGWNLNANEFIPTSYSDGHSPVQSTSGKKNRRDRNDAKENTGTSAGSSGTSSGGGRKSRRKRNDSQENDEYSYAPRLLSLNDFVVSEKTRMYSAGSDRDLGSNNDNNASNEVATTAQPKKNKKKQKCIFGSDCSNKSCPYYHPTEICRYLEWQLIVETIPTANMVLIVCLYIQKQCNYGKNECIKMNLNLN
jgi:hypothetical protein